MIEQIDDLEFQDLQADKRHKELIDAITTLTAALKQDSGDDVAIAQFIQKNNKTLDELIKKLQGMQTTQPQINVDQQSVIAAIRQMATEMAQNITQLRDCMKEAKPAAQWEFDVKRNAYGFIQTITAKTK